MQSYIIGTIAIMIIGGIAMFVAFSNHKSSIYGKATLAYIGLFIIVYALARWSIIVDVQSREAAGQMIGLASIAFAISLTEIVFLHSLQHYHTWREMRKLPACRGDYHERIP